MSAVHGSLQPSVLTVYGVDWCEDTTRARKHLYTAGTRYHYVRLDDDDAAKVELHRAGHRATPVVVTPAGRLYVEPTDEQLKEIVIQVGPGS